MRIAKLHMDPQDKTRFEIHGKSSVKYHLKANHAVEAKRWFWALNNAIQWTKDEAKEEERSKQKSADALRQARFGKDASRPDVTEGADFSGQGLTSASSVGAPLTTTTSRASFQETIGGGSVIGDDDGSINESYEPNLVGNEMTRSTKGANSTFIAGDMDDDEEYGDDASSHEVQPATKDAFNITAHSASMQLSLLAQVSNALQTESARETAPPLSDPAVGQAISTYQAAVSSLQSLVGDLLKIARDRESYWQYRLDQEADIRRMWEDSMAKVAREHEELQGKIGESEDKRKRTKRALREALEGGTPDISRPASRDLEQDHIKIAAEAVAKSRGDKDLMQPYRRRSTFSQDPRRRKSTIADLTNLSDSDSEDDEEFFDAVDAGEIEVVDEMPVSVGSPPPPTQTGDTKAPWDLREAKKAEIEPSFHGYEDPVRQRFRIDADDRPKISLWVSRAQSCGGFKTLTCHRAS